MKALIDGDILLYEIGFGAEKGWRVKTERDELPPWEYVNNLLHYRLNEILDKTSSDSYQIYLTEGRTFRYDLATVKPYKGNRKDHKPWHFKNLKAYMVGSLGARLVTNIEADDQLAIDHLVDKETIICSRDKDLRQVPGLFFSWELGRQPQFGPTMITEEGSLSLEKGKLSGMGFAFFCAQVLMGDATDNIPGLPGCGPVAAWNALTNGDGDPQWMATELEQQYYAHDSWNWEERLLEQGRLCWMTRRLNEDGSPVLWEIGMIE